MRGSPINVVLFIHLAPPNSYCNVRRSEQSSLRHQAPHHGRAELSRSCQGRKKSGPWAVIAPDECDPLEWDAQTNATRTRRPRLLAPALILISAFSVAARDRTMANPNPLPTRFWSRFSR